MQKQNIDDFINQLLIDKGITDLDPEIEAELKNDMKNRLLDQINKATIMQLSEDQAIELASLVDSPDYTEEKLADFLKHSGLDFTEIVVTTMLQFRNFYLNPET